MINVFSHLAPLAPPGVVGNIPAPPPRPTRGAVGVGSVPRGFFEIAQPGECDQFSPAFLRGTLLTRAEYDALPISAPPPAKSKTTLQLTPRWTLYGGPLESKKLASEWQTYMQFWAQNQGLLWQPFDEPCIVKSHRIQWPADSSFQWTWVRETYPPQRVIRTSQGRYVWENPQ